MVKESEIARCAYRVVTLSAKLASKGFRGGAERKASIEAEIKRRSTFLKAYDRFGEVAKLQAVHAARNDEYQATGNKQGPKSDVAVKAGKAFDAAAAAE